MRARENTISGAPVFTFELFLLRVSARHPRAVCGTELVGGFAAASLSSEAIFGSGGELWAGASCSFTEKDYKAIFGSGCGALGGAPCSFAEEDYKAISGSGGELWGGSFPEIWGSSIATTGPCSTLPLIM